MRVCNLGSGSDGNLTYIESENCKILIDIGFCCNEVVKRLSILNVSPEEINAILITHEHSDHIKGLDVFARKYGTKIYAHENGINAIKGKLKKSEKIQFICFSDNYFYIKDLKIKSFKLSHDSEYCCGFTISENDKQISMLTDCGYINSEIINNLKGSRLVFLEANHDKQMLKNNLNYPLSLKQRISGKKGHLSNDDAGEIIEYLAQNGTKQIMLSHLSRENNTPELAYKTICEYLKTKNITEGLDIKISVTSEMPSNIFRLN